MIIGKDMRVADVAFQVGHESPSYFNREYRKMLGKPSRKNRKENLNLYNMQSRSRSRIQMRLLSIYI
ncbi:hypothetical protein [Bacillus tequilensis]|uniref:hypothetical protein n=1 Tax=Bacillus tequilensis TaxID=227866 RepID=UPI00046730AF|nr:hypothetical protein [Bacillus tequilensis]